MLPPMFTPSMVAAVLELREGVSAELAKAWAAVARRRPATPVAPRAAEEVDAPMPLRMPTEPRRPTRRAA